MIFMRAFFRGLMLFVVLLSASLWIVAATLQSTLLNRDAVKQWGAESGAYENVMATFEIRQADATGFIDDATLRQAMDETLAPTYIQEQSEVVVDAFYDWVDGESADVTYTIPLQERRDDFIDILAGKLEAKVSGLPQCTGSLSLQQECIPRTYTTETYATTIAEQTAKDSDLFEEAIVAEAVEPTGVIAVLPALAYWSALANWVLPIVVVVMSIGYVLLSRRWRMGIENLGKRLVFSSVLLVAVGVVTWLFGGSLDLGARLFGGSDTALIAGVIEPILRQAIPAIGMWLTIWSGCVLVLGVLLWIVGFILQRQTAGGSTNSTPVPLATPTPQPSTPPKNPSPSSSPVVAPSKPSMSAEPLPSMPQKSLAPPEPSAPPALTPPRNTAGSVSSSPRPQSPRPPRRPISF